MTSTYTPTDPLLSSQWHLYMIGRLGYGMAADLSGLQRVWSDYTGLGVDVGIWDSGVEATHWDLAANYDASQQVTIGGILNNGQPLTASDGHGTSVAGLIAADNNGRGGAGIAFDSSVTSIRIFGGADDINSFWSRYLQTLDHLGDFDVTNHSYGAFPNFTVDSDIAKFRAAAETGRSGLGTVNVKSAGNDNVDGNGDALDASRFTVTVGAINSSGQAASYSTYGAHLLVSAPAGAVTTDMTGIGRGYDGLLSGDYTNGFGGTSAAGPVTVGVISLMYDANEGLGWRDVQNILAYSATGVGSIYGGASTNEGHAWKWNGADNWNGGGLHFSEDYGYGMVNAYNAVRLAEVWGILFPQAATSANEAVVATGTVTANDVVIADVATTTFTFNVTGNIRLEHVDLTLSFSHSYFTDLEITMVSPDGTVMSLYDGSTGSSGTSDSGLTYTFGIDGLRGEMSAGTWTVRISDVYALDEGVLNSVALTGYGSTPTADDVYHYTDEILSASQAAGQSGRSLLADTDGGTDWLNAAAMSRGLVLDLNTGANSTLAGTAFLAIALGTAIENAIAGDGNDRVNGNSLNNVIYGMRGDDILTGGDGIDTAAYLGNYADYVITATGGVTTVSGADGSDTLTFFELLRFADQTIADPSAGITPTDLIAPELVQALPLDNAANVAVDTNITLTFDEDVKAGTGLISIYGPGSTLFAAFDVTDTTQVVFSGASVTINPDTNLAFGAQYHVLIGSGAITDLAGNAFAGISDSSVLNFLTVSEITIVTGNSLNNTLNGTDGRNELYGLGGNDTLNGLGGDDLLNGGTGTDTMTGGSGNDIYIVDSSRDRVVELAGGGTDTVRTSLSSLTLSGNTENLIYTGSVAASLTGNSGNNSISGGNGADTLKGGAGSDTLLGGNGRDALYGGSDSARDTFVFTEIVQSATGSGRDQVFDFLTGTDLLDFSGIDASTAPSDQAFAFSGNAAQPNSVWYERSGANVIISADVTGDSTADFQVLLRSVNTLAESDLLF